MTEPRWLTRARAYIGLAEIPGPKNHPTIVKWWEALKAPFRDDLTSWCGGFVGGVFSESGIAPAANPWGARKWLNFGTAITKPIPGAVVVFWRGDPKGWSGHVGFVVGRDKNFNLMVLGGNQSDAVNIKPFSTSRVLGYRWPKGEPMPANDNLPLVASNGKVSNNEA